MRLTRDFSFRQFNNRIHNIQSAVFSFSHLIKFVHAMIDNLF